MINFSIFVIIYYIIMNNLIGLMFKKMFYNVKIFIDGLNS